MVATIDLLLFLPYGTKNKPNITLKERMKANTTNVYRVESIIEKPH